MKYFSKLPIVTYNGYTVRNVMARVKFTEDSIRNSRAFYPYTMKHQDRVDLVSNDYYGNPDYAWLIWMANGAVDPYYDIGMSDDNFKAMIVKKYGSIEKAQRKISYYRTDPTDDVTELTIAQYTALSASLKKYFKPVVDYNGTTVSYVRSKDYVTVSTNKIIQLDIDTTVGTFTVGEEIRVDANNYAFVVTANSSLIMAQHVTGNLTANSTITGVESGATANVVTNTTIRQNIPVDEFVYWIPVTYYDHEEELLAQDKEIILVDSSQTGKVTTELTNLLRRS